jgi:CSLREA domain-containing protein
LCEKVKFEQVLRGGETPKENLVFKRIFSVFILLATSSKPTLNIFTLITLLASLLGNAMFIIPVHAAPEDSTIRGTDLYKAQSVLAITTRYVDATGGTDDSDCSDSGDPCLTLTYAISQALSGDAIEMAEGTYTEAGITVNKDLTITGAGMATTIIQADTTIDTAADRVFHVVSGVVVMNDLTIQNGRSPNGADATSDCTSEFDCFDSDGGPAEDGGGILNEGTLTLNQVTLANNRGGTGGAAGDISCGPSEEFCFTSGGDGGHGAAIFSTGTGTLTINDSVFSGNQTGSGGPAGAENCTGDAFCGSSVGSSGEGGGLSFGANPTVNLTGVTFSNNTAGAAGGAINQNGSVLTIVNSSFTGNTSAIAGGAVNCNSGADDCTISGSTFSGNSATGGYGGGAISFFNNGIKTVSNSTISGNTSNGDGGGIRAFGGPVNLNFVTLAGNTADNDNNGSGDGGGILRTFATVNLNNTIIADNIDKSSQAPDCSGALTTQFYNLIENLTGCTFTAGTGDITGSDPALDVLADNGGTTQTHALLAGSPAIDAGTNTGCPATDQRGVARPYGGFCDIGAFEVGPTQPGPDFVVNTSADTDDGFCDLLGQGSGNQDCTLREAINAANAVSGTDTITFDSALSGATIHLASTLVISNDLTIDGSSLASRITLSGDSDNNGIGDVRVFSTSSPDIFDRTITMDSIILAKGYVVGEGGGLLVGDNTVVNVVNSLLSGNSATNGGALSIYGTANIIDSTFSGNSSASGAGGGGAILNSQILTIHNSTFSDNTANNDGSGGALFNTSPNATITNSTFSGNAAGVGGAIITTNSLTITNSTISGNSAIFAGGLSIQGHTTNLINTIIANSTGGDCDNLAIIGTNLNNLIEDGSCSPSLSGDPKLGPLQDNGGFTETMALGSGSPAINTGNDASCPAMDQRGLTRPQGSHCDIGAYEAQPANVDLTLGSTNLGTYSILPGTVTRQSFVEVNNGPMQILSSNSIPLIGAERVIYKINGIQTSFSEMMGLPNSQLDTTYWLPWYNNVDLDTQIRFANVTGTTATVHVSIGGVPMTGSPFTLEAGETTRVSFPGINDGPVKIESDQNIVAAERVIYKINNINTSFSEMMALPSDQLDTTYWLPWYNNVGLDTQLRFANVTGFTATVHVSIGGVPMSGSPFTLEAGETTRVSFAGINDGPVKIESDQNIVAAERVIYKINGVNTSFSEMMGLPNSQLDTTYWFPWYNNVDLDTQLRFANVSASTATVHISIGGVPMTGSPFTLEAGETTHVSFAGIDDGPVKIKSDQNIVAAERVIYKINGINTSFSEMMGLPSTLLDVTYWFPWYNNVDLDTQLRFGAP